MLNLRIDRQKVTEKYPAGKAMKFEKAMDGLTRSA
jgi:hypothetical protein